MNAINERHAIRRFSRAGAARAAPPCRGRHARERSRRPHHLQRQGHDAGSRPPGRLCRCGQGRKDPRRGRRQDDPLAARPEHESRRRQGSPLDPGPQRFAPAPHARSALLQRGAAVGWRAHAQAGARDGAQGRGDDARRQVGARDRRLVAVSVRGTPHAHAGGADRSGAEYAGVRAASVQLGHLQQEGPGSGGRDCDDAAARRRHVREGRRRASPPAAFSPRRSRLSFTRRSAASANSRRKNRPRPRGTSIANSTASA